MFPDTIANQSPRHRSFSTALILLAIAAPILAPAPAGAQLVATRVGSTAPTVLTARPVATPVATAQPLPTVGAATFSGANIPASRVDVVPTIGFTSTGCSSAIVNTLLDTGPTGPVIVDCKLTLTLPPGELITRKIVFSGAGASGSTLQCSCDTAGNCATLEGGISVEALGESRPEDVTVRNCTITGNVRLEIPNVCPQTPCADTKPDFPEWIRARAPRRITFDHVTIAGSSEKDRFYVGWGATETKLINSTIKGGTKGVPIYLGPHSTGAVIKNNQFFIETTDHDRELIAIDGSDRNQIISNWFTGLHHGGIYLFRNCGEGGHIRHINPSYNQIVNNVFYYDGYDGPRPSVYIGSRNGNPPGFELGDWGSYCNDDEGYPYGSSADDRDFATHNVVMQNEIVKRSLTDMIRSTNWVNNEMNRVDRNQTVTAAQAKWPRPAAGCYVRGGINEFILNGQTTDKFMADDGTPSCETVKCVDGELRPVPQAASFEVAPSGLATRSTTQVSNVCNVRQVPINCQINGDDRGCHQTVFCPTGTKVVGAVAACNLEYGTVSDAELATVPPNLLHVAVFSDHLEDGSCYIGNNSVVGEIVTPPGFPLVVPYIPESAVQSPIRGIVGLDRVAVGCQEHDKNGGDCQVRGSLYCR